MCFFFDRTNVVMNYTETESKVREATNDDPWGPSGQLMGEIARYVERISMFDWRLLGILSVNFILSVN